MMSKQLARRSIVNFEARSVALFVTLTLGSALASQAQTGAPSPFVIGGTKSPPTSSSANGTQGATPAAPRASDVKAPLAKDADKSKEEAKKGEGKVAEKADVPKIGKGESPPEPKTGGAKY